MRVADRPLPVVDYDAASSLAAWPVRPVIALGHTSTPPYGWDDAWLTWDDPGVTVWDVGAALPTRVDATCDWTGLELEYGPNDDRGLFPAAHLVVQLDNTAGTWSHYNIDGSPTEYGPGAPVDVWAHNAAGDWWLFSGTVARWDERGDNVVEFEAFDTFSDLAQSVGTFTPGVAGDTPALRLEAVLAVAGRAGVPHRFAPGLVTLTAQESDVTPLEEMQTVASSDGGVLYGDADGTVTYVDRAWRSGRTDQTAYPVASDNVCTADVIVWDAVLSTNDAGLADTVILENVAGLRAQAPGVVSGFVVAESDHQWTTQAEGDTLAGALLVAQRQPRVAVDSFDLYLLDPAQPDLWRAVDWRLLDRLRFLHDTPVVGGTARLDVTALVVSLAHSITPDGWVMTVATSRALSYVAPVLWDTLVYPWDAADPLAVWGY